MALPGAPCRRRSSIASNSSRSSAASICLELRAQDGNAGRLHSALASLMAVCPPNCTTTPTGCSTSRTLSTSSVVSGSKYKPVGGIKVGGYRFGIVVDDDGIIPRLFQRPDAVYRAIVKLHALADADGAAAQHHHGFLFACCALRFLRS